MSKLIFPMNYLGLDSLALGLEKNKSVSDLFFSFCVGREGIVFVFYLYENGGIYENFNQACHIKNVVSPLKR